MDKIKRIMMTMLIVIVYCIIWEVLELLLEGSIQNREVDNIIMVLFIPIIYIATKKC